MIRRIVVVVTGVDFEKDFAGAGKRDDSESCGKEEEGGLGDLHCGNGGQEQGRVEKRMEWTGSKRNGRKGRKLYILSTALNSSVIAFHDLLEPT